MGGSSATASGSSRLRGRKSVIGGQTFDTTIPYDTTRDDQRIEGKLTWRITDQHTLVGSYIDSDLERRNFVTSGRVVTCAASRSAATSGSSAPSITAVSSRIASSWRASTVRWSTPSPSGTTPAT
ncbi:MAG TPA: hypothetical protein VJ885_16820 [Thermoanaerobaculia bacterium]|nr:hypothetical protein [Thermoanaerobaculia bacterium]